MGDDIILIGWKKKSEIKEEKIVLRKNESDQRIKNLTSVCNTINIGNSFGVNYILDH